MNLLSGKSQNPLIGWEKSSAGEEGIINHLEKKNTDPESISFLLGRAHTSFAGYWVMPFSFSFYIGNHHCMYSINLVSLEQSYKGSRGQREKERSCQHWAAAQPILDCRYKHYTLYQQSCREWAINLPGGALQGRLTMQVQSVCYSETSWAAKNT